jgi:hypothetical protein
MDLWFCFQNLNVELSSQSKPALVKGDIAFELSSVFADYPLRPSVALEGNEGGMPALAPQVGHALF